MKINGRFTSDCGIISCDDQLIKQTKEEIKQGVFSSFDKLNESQKGVVAKDWDKNMRMKYLNRHDTISEEEFFKELDEIAQETYDANSCLK